MDLLTVLQKQPIIGAFRDITRIPFQLLNRTDILFILGGTLLELPEVMEQAKKYKKVMLVDVDLIKGIGKDAAGIQFLAKKIQVQGIISTHSNLITSAQKEGLISIQRLFILDSESLERGLSVIEKVQPDFLEILPGLIVPKIMERIKQRIAIPVIAGGLITKEEEIRQILSSGAVGVSMSSTSLLTVVEQG